MQNINIALFRLICGEVCVLQEQHFLTISNYVFTFIFGLEMFVKVSVNVYLRTFYLSCLHHCLLISVIISDLWLFLNPYSDFLIQMEWMGSILGCCLDERNYCRTKPWVILQKKKHAANCSNHVTNICKLKLLPLTKKRFVF